MIDGKYADYKGETYKVVEIVGNELVRPTPGTRLPRAAAVPWRGRWV